MSGYSRILALSAVLIGSALALPGQATDGNIVGAVLDPSGSGIATAEVALEHPMTGARFRALTDDAGLYRFWNVPAGDYRLSAEADGFGAKTLENIGVELSRTKTVNVQLEINPVTTSMTVIESPTHLDTTSSSISSSFDTNIVTYNPGTDLAEGVLNLSLLSAGVASSGGLGLGEGPAIGGQRPRNNSFMIEGVDNNDKTTSGPVLQVPNEAVAQFSVLQNQYSAEFGRSAGGQFETVIKSGTNDLHGSLYEYFGNRHLNSVDEANARRGIRENPRFDDNRVGGTVGGPVKRNRLFYFGAFEFNPIGEAASPGSPFRTPTADGFRTLNGVPGLSSTNLGVLQEHVPAAPSADAVTLVSGVEIPVGPVPVNQPTYQDNYSWLASLDYVLSDKDQLRGRYVDNSQDAVNPLTVPQLPGFAGQRAIRHKLATLSHFHVFSPSISNELRLGYSRLFEDLPAGNFSFPGLDAFPNITIEQDLGLQLGPFFLAPQGRSQNNYQLVNNSTWIRGRHTLRFGVDLRKNITSDFFVDRQRGDYNYSSLERFLLDLSPDLQAQRNTGGATYHGNHIEAFWFVNDEIRLKRNLTLNLGLRHEYKGVPASDKLQALNAASSVPGLLEIREPRAQTKNFAPRLGLAYSPGEDGKFVLRAGFGMSYDSYPLNFGLLTKPPQLENTFRLDPGVTTPGFLASGGIRAEQRPAELDPAAARSLTSAFIHDQHLPYAMHWNAGVERVFGENYAVNVRYVGTRGVRLFTQDIMTFVARANPQQSLPTFLQAPSQGELDQLALTLDDLAAQPPFDLRFLTAGFGPVIFNFPNRGNSTYHGLATEVKRRFSGGLQFIGAYTWSRTIDDSTAELGSTLLSPRRPLDFFDRSSEKAKSFLDRAHRFTMAWVWETPYANSGNRWKAAVLGNWVLSGVYTAESPQYATVQSGVDSNLNLDSATDRALINVNGLERVGSGVSPLTNSGGQIVGYLANNPNAQYITAGPGVHPNGGRNTLPLAGINNFDVSVTRRIPVGESKMIELRAAFYNALNHAQYVPGSLNSVRAVSSATTRNNLIPDHPAFDRPDLIYNSHAREIRLALRFTF